MVLMVLCVNKCLGLFFTRYIGHQPFAHANARIPCAVVCGGMLPETLEGRADGVRRGDKETGEIKKQGSDKEREGR